jgi:glycosyltransferase involved in cell wall biosynthesis
MKPLVSVGIPTYNRPEGLRRTLDKFTAQTYLNLEIIVSDNCSINPEVKIIAEEFAAKDSRIKYYRQDSNIGINLNFKFVLSKSSGKYFMWASDDDYFHECFIERLVVEMENNYNLVLCCSSTVFERTNGFKEDVNQNITTIGLNKIERIHKMIEEVHLYCVGFYGLYRNKYLKQIHISNFFLVDKLMLVELTQFGEYLQVPEKYFHYIESHNQASNSDDAHFAALNLSVNLDKINFFLSQIKKYKIMKVFLFFSKSSLSWKTLSLREHLLVIKLIKDYFYVNDKLLFKEFIKFQLYSLQLRFRYLVIRLKSLFKSSI